MNGTEVQSWTDVGVGIHLVRRLGPTVRVLRALGRLRQQETRAVLQGAAMERKQFFCLGVGLVLPCWAAALAQPGAAADGPVDFYDCTGKPDGNYVHPFDCTKFISCAPVGQPFVPEVWNHSLAGGTSAGLSIAGSGRRPGSARRAGSPL